MVVPIFGVLSQHHPHFPYETTTATTWANAAKKSENTTQFTRASGTEIHQHVQQKNIWKLNKNHLNTTYKQKHVFFSKTRPQPQLHFLLNKTSPPPLLKRPVFVPFFGSRSCAARFPSAGTFSET